MEIAFRRRRRPDRAASEKTTAKQEGRHRRRNRFCHPNRRRHRDRRIHRIKSKMMRLGIDAEVRFGKLY